MNENITITIPTFNRSHYLKEAIESVIKQTYTNFKLVILDNASTDDTETIVRKFDDSRILYTKSVSKLNFARSLNRSFDYCESDYLMIFHDDDILHENFLKNNISALNDDPNLCLVASSMHIIDENGTKIKDEQIIEHDLIFFQFGYWRAYYKDKIFLPMPTVIFRSKYLKVKKFLFRDFVGPNLDQYMWFEMNNEPNSKFLLRKEQLYYYRRHFGQSTNWELQGILLDRKAYWLALDNKITDVVEKIDAIKHHQMNYLIKYCINSNTNLFNEISKEGYWDSINSTLKIRIKIYIYSSMYLLKILHLIKKIKN